MPPATVANVSTRAILHFCAGRGVDPSTLLSVARIDPTCVEDSGSRIPVEHVSALWAEAQRRTGDEAIALHVSELLPFGANKIVDYLLITSLSAGEGLRRGARYHL
jgi:hypothetical protein